MHGLVNKALQDFVTDTYGDDAWTSVAEAAGLGVSCFQPMLQYADEDTDAVLAACVEILGKPRSALLEDFGLYLVAHPDLTVVRRLLRFGGADFYGFLISLEDLPERARLAVPELEMPGIEIEEHADGKIAIALSGQSADFRHLLAGVLQGMADEYGALATIETVDAGQKPGCLTVQVHDADYKEARVFDLGNTARARR